MKLKKEQGWRISKKRNKLKSPCNKKGMRCDLKYIHKKLSMSLQLRSDNEKIFWSSLKEEEHSLRILLNTNIKSMIICVPSSDGGTNHFVLGLPLN